METAIFKVLFNDGREYKVFCQGRNQIKRFNESFLRLKSEIKDVSVLTNGIHTISEFEKLKA